MSPSRRTHRIRPSTIRITLSPITIGTAIPSAPVIAIFENGARIFIGVEGGIVSMPAIATPDMYRYYWHQKF